VNLQRAAYLVALAKYMNFTRAAASLYIAQSALSQQIKVLERELGVTLVERHGPRISLTPAGEVAVTEAQHLLGTADRAVQRIRAADVGSGAVLRVALTRSWAGGAVEEVFDAFRERYPDVTIQEQRRCTAVNVDLIAQCAVDVAVVRPPLFDDRVSIRAVDSERLVIALPAGHRLADGQPIDPDQLADEPVVLWPRENAPGLYDLIVGAVWPSARPRVRQLEPDYELTLRAVAAGVGIAPIPVGRARAFAVPGVEIAELAGRPVQLPVALAVRGDNKNPAARAFDVLLDEYLARAAS